MGHFYLITPGHFYLVITTLLNLGKEVTRSGDYAQLLKALCIPTAQGAPNPMTPASDFIDWRYLRPRFWLPSSRSNPFSMDGTRR